MKNQAKRKYAQLEESLSPEPQGNETSSYSEHHHHRQTSAPRSHRDGANMTRDLSNTSLNGTPPSSCQSLARSAPNCSAGFLVPVELDPPIECGDTNDAGESTASLEASSQASHHLFYSTEAIRHVAGSNGHPRRVASAVSAAANLNCSISQSMLALDRVNGSRVSAFLVHWTHLSFAYSGGWFKRLVGRGGGRRAARPVLRSISGSFKSNQLVAVIGPSGCGKTTLLHCLAGNIRSGRPDAMRIVGLDEPKVALIGQYDCLLPGLTARETLLYASRLQNNRPGFDHVGHIGPIIAGLGLSECADQSVTKLSGGQMKRVVIGQELLYPTNLLILDEITSGLDASTCFSIVSLLKKLVSDPTYPMSIVMSIHQPSAKLFDIFDRVYVMSEGGCIYEGGCQVALVNKHLNSFGLECPKFHNIADFLIEIASDEGAHASQTRTLMRQFQEKKSQPQYDDHVRAISDSNGKLETTTTFIMDLPSAGEQEFDPSSKPLEDVASLAHSQHELRCLTENGDSLFEAIERARLARERPFFQQFCILYSRSILRIRRSHVLTHLQLISYILLGLQLSTFYGPEIGNMSGCPKLPVSFMTFILAHQLDDTNLAHEMRRVQENMNFLLVAVMTATFAALEITVITFPLEAKTVKREWCNGWYRVSSYFLGRTMADLPFHLVFVVIFSAIIYTLTGQIGLFSWRFCSFALIMILIALVAQSVGFIFGAVFMDNLPAAVFTAPLSIFPALLFSGFFSRVSEVPAIYRPMTNLSHFRYAFDALLVTLYGYGRCDCDQSALDNYQQSLKTQPSVMKDVFTSLFGSMCCESSNENSDEDSIEDTAKSKAISLIAANITNTTLSPVAMTKPLEDALVDQAFNHLKNDTASTHVTYTDTLAQRFSQQATAMLNTQANYGHPIPTQCEQFNSYLITEFDLRNSDLITGLIILFIFVVISRLLCNVILNFTIATRVS